MGGQRSDDLQNEPSSEVEAIKKIGRRINHRGTNRDEYEKLLVIFSDLYELVDIVTNGRSRASWLQKEKELLGQKIRQAASEWDRKTYADRLKMVKNLTKSSSSYVDYPETF